MAGKAKAVAVKAGNKMKTGGMANPNKATKVVPSMKKGGKK